MNLIGFIVLTVLAVGSAVMVITRRNPVESALALAGNLLAIAGFYLLLHAQFIALLQVIVYAGAIMVLILFVIMMLNLPSDSARRQSGFVQFWGGLALATAFAVILGRVFADSLVGQTFGEHAPDFGTVRVLGTELFSRFFYAFEAISLLLIVAMIGAVLLGKRRI